MRFIPLARFDTHAADVTAIAAFRIVPEKLDIKDWFIPKSRVAVCDAAFPVLAFFFSVGVGHDGDRKAEHFGP